MYLNKIKEALWSLFLIEKKHAMSKACYFFVWILAWGCHPATHQEEQEMEISVRFPDTTQIQNLSGEQLAYQYCQQCHLFPDPALLTKELWEKGVLPRMAPRLGINTSLSLYAGLSYEEIQVLSQAEIFPNEKKITEKAWQKLVDYYLTHAPDSMPVSEKQVFADSLSFFRTEEIHFNEVTPPVTTLIHYDTKASRLWVGSRTGNIKILDNKQQLIDTLQSESPLVDVVDKDTARYLLSVGLMDPSDKPMGTLVQLGNKQYNSKLLKDLHRPVHLAITDLNQDGVQDYVIANFGNYVGNLSWYDGTDHKKHVLDPNPGCVKTEIHDFNQDGLPDIMALMAQGDERIIILYNKGKGSFQRKMVLRFPPVYGSSYFELADFNKDGKLDILYTNGDNADFSVALKNYHGVRIFENQGNDNFEERFFYPSYGTTMAKAADFDLDGDLDIAVIAFFANFVDTPQKSFLFLENVSDGKYSFRDYTTPEAEKGRWLTFDIGDIDEDGDQDIILGGYVFGPAHITRPLQEKWINSAPDILILRNNQF